MVVGSFLLTKKQARSNNGLVRSYFLSVNAEVPVGVRPMSNASLVGSTSFMTSETNHPFMAR